MSCHNSCWVPPFKKQCTNLSLAITGTPSLDGRFWIYTFIVTNNGPLTAQNVVLNVTFTGALNGPQSPIWTFSPNAASTTVNSLAPGQTLLDQFTGAPPKLLFGLSPSSVTATVISGTPECNPSDNTATSTH